MLPTGVYSVLKNTVEPRMSQTVVPVALRKSPYIIFYEKTEIVTNGLLKMCLRLEPQQHFEAACCSGITIFGMARVSWMPVCKMSPRLKPRICSRFLSLSAVVPGCPHSMIPELWLFFERSCSQNDEFLAFSFGSASGNVLQPFCIDSQPKDKDMISPWIKYRRNCCPVVGSSFFLSSTLEGQHLQVQNQ